METISIKAHTNNNSQIESIKSFLQSLKIKFELYKEPSPYNQSFVEKIQQGDKDIKNGKGTRITIEELNNLWK